MKKLALILIIIAIFIFCKEFFYFESQQIITIENGKKTQKTVVKLKVKPIKNYIEYGKDNPCKNH